MAGQAILYIQQDRLAFTARFFEHTFPSDMGCSALAIEGDGRTINEQAILELENQTQENKATTTTLWEETRRLEEKREKADSHSRTVRASEDRVQEYQTTIANLQGVIASLKEDALLHSKQQERAASHGQEVEELEGRAQEYKATITAVQQDARYLKQAKEKANSELHATKASLEAGFQRLKEEREKRDVHVKLLRSVETRARQYKSTIKSLQEGSRRQQLKTEKVEGDSQSLNSTIKSLKEDSRRQKQETDKVESDFQGLKQENQKLRRNASSNGDKYQLLDSAFPMGASYPIRNGIDSTNASAAGIHLGGNANENAAGTLPGDSSPASYPWSDFQNFLWLALDLSSSSSRPLRPRASAESLSRHERIRHSHPEPLCVYCDGAKFSPETGAAAVCSSPKVIRMRSLPVEFTAGHAELEGLILALETAARFAKPKQPVYVFTDSYSHASVPPSQLWGRTNARPASDNDDVPEEPTFSPDRGRKLQRAYSAVETLKKRKECTVEVWWLAKNEVVPEAKASHECARRAALRKEAELEMTEDSLRFMIARTCVKDALVQAQNSEVG
ncbi:MAG: hypothetical protein M1831_005587 [Alyxoria varia]|nr:MAG: hypothetical protein M1831_005587 [Alyxoria varia]